MIHDFLQRVFHDSSILITATLEDRTLPIVDAACSHPSRSSQAPAHRKRAHIGCKTWLPMAYGPMATKRLRRGDPVVMGDSAHQRRAMESLVCERQDRTAGTEVEAEAKVTQEEQRSVLKMFCTISSRTGHSC